jgi:hypothetical protein
MKMVMCYDIENVEVALRALLCLHMSIKRKAEIGNNLRDFIVSDFAISQIMNALLMWNTGHITRAFMWLAEPSDSIDTIMYAKTAVVRG